MRKIFYTLLFALASSLTISACTEEQVTPTDNTGGSTGGGGSVDPIKP